MSTAKELLTMEQTTKPMALTFEIIKATRPCHYYPDERIRALLATVDNPTVRDLADCELPIKDRVLTLIRLLPVSDRAVFAQWCADQAQSYAANANVYVNAYANAAAYAADNAADNAADIAASPHAASTRTMMHPLYFIVDN